MPNFLINIALHHAHSTDYNMLYEQMEKKGFSRTLFATKDNVEHHLLHSEYRITSSSKPATKNNSAEDATALYVAGLVDAALNVTIAESKKNGRTSYLTASYTLAEYSGSIWFKGLDVVNK